jgi:hypothetical protein
VKDWKWKQTQDVYTKVANVIHYLSSRRGYFGHFDGARENTYGAKIISLNIEVSMSFPYMKDAQNTTKLNEVV